jgi:hypothetical protein
MKAHVESFAAMALIALPARHMTFARELGRRLPRLARRGPVRDCAAANQLRKLTKPGNPQRRPIGSR